MQFLVEKVFKVKNMTIKSWRYFDRLRYLIGFIQSFNFTAGFIILAFRHSVTQATKLEIITAERFFLSPNILALAGHTTQIVLQSPLSNWITVSIASYAINTPLIKFRQDYLLLELVHFHSE